MANFAPGAQHDAGCDRPVAIVTGAVSGIGLASAIALAEQGHDLLLHGLDDAGSPEVERALAIVRRGGSCVRYVDADLREPEQASCTIVEAARAHWGRIDTLVCSAGVSAHAPLATVTERIWADVLAVNLLAPFFLAQKAFDDLVRAGGAIIMVSSTNALVANRDNAVYDVSKAALNHLVLNLALELRDRGVRVNAVMPGATETDLLSAWAADVTGSAAGADAVVSSARERGQLATPADIGRAVAVLAGSGASWVSGALIPVDGGFRLGD